MIEGRSLDVGASCDCSTSIVGTTIVVYRLMFGVFGLVVRALPRAIDRAPPVVAGSSSCSSDAADRSSGSPGSSCCCSAAGSRTSSGRWLRRGGRTGFWAMLALDGAPGRAGSPRHRAPRRRRDDVGARPRDGRRRRYRAAVDRADGASSGWRSCRRPSMSWSSPSAGRAWPGARSVHLQALARCPRSSWRAGAAAGAITGPGRDRHRAHRRGRRCGPGLVRGRGVPARTSAGSAGSRSCTC